MNLSRRHPVPEMVICMPFIRMVPGNGVTGRVPVIWNRRRLERTIRFISVPGITIYTQSILNGVSKPMTVYFPIRP